MHNERVIALRDIGEISIKCQNEHCRVETIVPITKEFPAICGVCTRPFQGTDVKTLADHLFASLRGLAKQKEVEMQIRIPDNESKGETSANKTSSAR
jgi:hypothetical protein